MLEITLKSPYQFAHILFQSTIVPHGGHYHFIPESDLSAGELAATYVFNPNDIVRDTGDAYIVRHGDHYHYIPKSSFNNPPSHSNTEEVGSSSSSVLSNPSLHVHHEEEDGHGFDANRIISEDSEGFVIPHGDHNHYIKVQTKGYEAALKNKIPSLQSNYQPGTFDEKAVLAKVDQLLADSRSIYKDRLS